MRPATNAKAAAIRAAVGTASGVHLAALLAMLTSANKDERENAKHQVRELVRTGTGILEAERNANALADFANRHEP